MHCCLCANAVLPVRRCSLAGAPILCCLCANAARAAHQFCAARAPTLCGCCPLLVQAKYDEVNKEYQKEVALLQAKFSERYGELSLSLNLALLVLRSQQQHFGSGGGTLCLCSGFGPCAGWGILPISYWCLLST